MAKKFNPMFDTDQPSIRIGTRVPKNSVNLAFVSAPELSPDTSIQIFDYSKRVPDNSSSINYSRVDMHPTTEGLLVGEDKEAMYPVSDVLLTNKYAYSGSNNEVVSPLYYRGETRFLHFEIGPPTDSVTGEYTGSNISLIENGRETDTPYAIFLTPTSDTRLWEVEVFSEKLSSDNAFYKIRYTKFRNKIPLGGGKYEYKYDPDFEEWYKAYPYFTNLGYSPSAIEGVKSSEFFTPVFASEKLGESGFRFWVTSKSTKVNRSPGPIIFRWRVTTSSPQQKSPWRQDILYSLESLSKEELKLYDVDDGYAKKLLISSPKNLFPLELQEWNPSDSSYDLELQEWNPVTKSWVSSSNIMTQVDEVTGSIYVFTDKNTGTISSLPARYDIDYEEETFPVTIEAYSNYVAPVEPSVTRNVASKALGATVSVSGVSRYPYRTSISSVIAGASSDIFLPRESSALNQKWKAESEDLSNPPMDNATVTIKTAKIEGEYQDVDSIEVLMGVSGILSNVTLKLENGQTISNSSIPSYPVETISGTLRGHKWNLDSPAKVTEIILTLSPTKWKTRSVFWLFKIFGAKDKYRTGMELIQVIATSRTKQGEPGSPWRKAATFHASSSKDMPFSKRLSEIINLLDLNPPQEVPTNSVRYRVAIGDATISSNPGYSPTSTLVFRNNKTGKLIYNTNESQVSGSSIQNTFSQTLHDISLQEAMRNITLMEIYNESYSLLKSNLFTLKSRESSNIFIKEMPSRSIDDMWFLKINNGSFSVKKFGDNGNLLIEYYIPEFGTQPFSDEFGEPYSISIEEEAMFIDNDHIRVQNAPIYVETNEGNPTSETLRVYLESERTKPLNQRSLLRVKDWNPATGDIYLEDTIEHNDTVLVDYVYEVTDYEYKGYGYVDPNNSSNNKFYHLDLNPMPGHKFTDMDGQLKDSSLLLDKNIYLYIVPAFIINNGADPLGDDYIHSENYGTLRHVIFDQEIPEDEALDYISSVSEHAIVLGKILVRNMYSPSMIELIDTRKRGGGFRDDLSPSLIKSLSPEAEYVWDIGSYDGHPFPVNGVIVITLPSYIQHQFSEEELRSIVEKYAAFGSYAIIKYE